MMLAFTISLLLTLQNPDVNKLRAKSDSLFTVWKTQWQKSEDMRIESSLLYEQLTVHRDRTDSLKSIIVMADSSAAENSIGHVDTVVYDRPAIVKSMAISQRKTDSLLGRWSATWRASDSLRVESMLARIKSDSLKKAADAVKVNKGKTADVATAEVLEFVADTGTASYYGNAFHGRPTSSGEKYDMKALTCAHRWLPFGTKLKVTNTANKKTTIVKVNDRGPWKHGRIIDVSRAAADELAFTKAGTATVIVEVVNESEPASDDD